MFSFIRTVFILSSTLVFLLPATLKAGTISEAFPQMMDECLSWMKNPIRSSLSSSWIEVIGSENTTGTVTRKEYVLAHKELPVLLVAKYIHDTSLPTIPVPSCTLSESSTERPRYRLRELDLGGAWHSVKPLPRQEMKAAMLKWAEDALKSRELVDITDVYPSPPPGDGKILADCSTNPTTLFQLYTDGFMETSPHKRMDVFISLFGQRYMCNDAPS